MLDPAKSGRPIPGFLADLRVPVVAAPMFIASTPRLVSETCAAGAMGAFPTVNARDTAELERWFDQIEAAAEQERSIGGRPAPHAPNLIVSDRSARRDPDLKVILRRRPRVVITSVGSPKAVLPALHDAGIEVWCDVATLHHAERAVEAGIDGLILLTAGAGGHTGAANPFAFVQAVRKRYDGVVALSGGLADGTAVWAARALGCDLAYLGTRFLATQEAGVDERHKQLVVGSGLDDVHLTSAITGLPTNVLRAALVAHGLDPEEFGIGPKGQVSDSLLGDGKPRRWKDLWSAGHSVAGVDDIPGARALVERITAEYSAAQRASLEALRNAPADAVTTGGR